MNLIQSINHIDNIFLTTIFNLKRRKIFSASLPWVSHSANGYYYPIIPLLIFLLNKNTGISFVVSGIIAFAIELPAYKMIKNCVRRNRPYQVQEGIKNRTIPGDKFSLPSGHTSAAVLIAVLLYHIFPPILVPAMFWAFFVGLSRVYLGVHYPTDIIAGVVLGSLSAITAIFIKGLYF